MLLSLNDIRGCDIKATDDEIGKASDFYFDDSAWVIRYLVVDTGWIFGRKVLVAPDAVKGVDLKDDAVALSLTKKEIEEGPGIGTDLPVSRREEMALRQHYRWSNYWEIYPAGVGAAPLIPPMGPGAAGESPEIAPKEAEMRERGDPNLRSAREVEGYTIQAKDGELGHVDDFIVEDGTWAIRYMVINTRNWLPGRQVVLAPDWAEGIDWAGRIVQVGMDRDTIKDSPTYDSDTPISREYEQAVYAHYGRKPYWE